MLDGWRSRCCQKPTAQLEALQLRIVLGVSCKIRASKASIAVVAFFDVLGVSIFYLSVLAQMLAASVLVLCQ